MKRSVVIGIVILILVIGGFVLSKGMSGNVVLGSTVHDASYENEYFEVGEMGSELNVEVSDNGTEDYGRSG